MEVSIRMWSILDMDDVAKLNQECSVEIFLIIKTACHNLGSELSYPAAHQTYISLKSDFRKLH